MSTLPIKGCKIWYFVAHYVQPSSNEKGLYSVIPAMTRVIFQGLPPSVTPYDKERVFRKYSNLSILRNMCPREEVFQKIKLSYVQSSELFLIARCPSSIRLVIFILLLLVDSATEWRCQFQLIFIFGDFSLFHCFNELCFIFYFIILANNWTFVKQIRFFKI